MERKDDVVAIDPTGSPESIAAALSGLHPADVAAALERADLDGRLLTRILAELDTDIAADVVINLDEPTIEEILGVLEPPEIAEITGELESDDAADVVGLLDEGKRGPRALAPRHGRPQGRRGPPQVHRRVRRRHHGVRAGLRHGEARRSTKPSR